MCTLILAIAAEGRWPVLIGSTRDEFRTRAWEAPAEWWPQEHPGVVGGRDLEAGGTWMAVAAGARRVAVILNRIEPSSVADSEARSRGALPLIAASRGAEAIAAEDLSLVRPFNLVVAAPGGVVWWRYDGTELSCRSVPAGLHILTAADLDDMSNPRQRYWLPEFEGARPAAPRPADLAPAGWGGWPELLADVDSPYDDPRALNVRRGGPDGAFGTISAALLALDEERIKFEFCPGPPNRTPWQRVI
jgi:Transport and Golgi organisation 2